MAMAKKTVNKSAETVVKSVKYFESVGRRKTSVARVRFTPHAAKKLEILVNGKKLEDYFPLSKLQTMVVAPSVQTECYGAVSAKVEGGGVMSQAEAVRLGLARTIIFFAPALRSKLKALGYLKRDPRMVERKKPGLRKARRPQQWRKR